MNTFIKRSIKIALAIVFIGAAAVPACAQKKINKNALKAAFGKKPPLTGTAPVVKPVPPRVPPTLQGAQVPTRFAVPNEALNTVVEREVGRHTLPLTTMANADMKMGKRAKQILQKIESIDSNLILDYDVYPQWKDIFTRSRYMDEIDRNLDFLAKIDESFKNYKDYSDIPNFLLMKNTIISEQAIKDATKHLSPDDAIIFEALLKKADNFLFIKHKGKVFIEKEHLVRSGGDLGYVIKRIAEAVKSVTLLNILSKQEVINFVNLRRQQIFDSLLQLYRGVNSLEEVTADITTQRTAEEIKSLVENLDPQNPLRQAIEGTLKDNGYIAPAE